MVRGRVGKMVRLNVVTLYKRIPSSNPPDGNDFFLLLFIPYLKFKFKDSCITKITEPYSNIYIS